LELMSARILGEDSSAQTGLTSPNRKQADFYLFDFGGCALYHAIVHHGTWVLPHSVVAEQ